MKFLKAIIVLMILTLVCVSSAGASGNVKFHIPEISNAAVGDTVDATLYVDNTLNPIISDIALTLDWTNGVLQYEGTTFTAGNTKVAEPVGTHLLTINIGDHTKGIATGDVALAHLKFKVLKPDNSPIDIKVTNLIDMAGTDITSKAVVSNGVVKVGTQTTVTPSALDPGYKYEMGSLESGGWQAYSMDVTATDDYDILALVYSQANNFELYVVEPATGAIVTSSTAPYSTENGLDFNWAVSTLNPGRYAVFVHSTSGSGNFAFIHFYNR